MNTYWVSLRFRWNSLMDTNKFDSGMYHSFCALPPELSIQGHCCPRHHYGCDADIRSSAASVECQNILPA